MRPLSGPTGAPPSFLARGETGPDDLSGPASATPAPSPLGETPPAPVPPGRRPGKRLAVVVAAVVVAAIAVAAAVTMFGPSAEPPPSGGAPSPTRTTVLFSDTFDGTDWCDYQRIQNRKYSEPACGYHDEYYALRHDNGAARFEVRPGDSVRGLGSGERSELSQDSASWQAHEGDEWFVQMRLRLAADFTPGSPWTILTQFHAGNGSPPVSLQVAPNGALILQSAGKAGDANRAAGKPARVLVPASDFMAMRGQWFDVNLHVRWSNRIESGGTEVRINGALVAPWRAQRTMASDRNYWKAGIYRAPTDTTTVVWMDDLVISAAQRN